MAVLNIPQRLNYSQAAAFLGIEPQTLRLWIATKRHAIPHYKLGDGKRARVRFDLTDLERFMAERRVTPAGN